MADDEIEITRGSGNVFADLGFPDADSHLLKASFVIRIQSAIQRRGLTQAQAGKIMGIGQPDVSRMLRGNFRDFSVERLMRFLQSLGYEIDIVLREPDEPAASHTIHVEPEAA
jgi:predicted XRE-type DNA-binding protein